MQLFQRFAVVGLTAFAGLLGCADSSSSPANAVRDDGATAAESSPLEKSAEAPSGDASQSEGAANGETPVVEVGETPVVEVGKPPVIKVKSKAPPE